MFPFSKLCTNPNHRKPLCGLVSSRGTDRVHQGKSNLRPVLPGTGCGCRVPPRGGESSPLRGSEKCLGFPQLGPTEVRPVDSAIPLLRQPCGFPRAGIETELPLQQPGPGFKRSNPGLTTLKSHQGEKEKHQSKSCLEKEGEPWRSNILCLLTSGRP